MTIAHQSNTAMLLLSANDSFVIAVFILHNRPPMPFPVAQTAPHLQSIPHWRPQALVPSCPTLRPTRAHPHPPESFLSALPNISPFYLHLNYLTPQQSPTHHSRPSLFPRLPLPLPSPPHTHSHPPQLFLPTPPKPPSTHFSRPSLFPLLLPHHPLFSITHKPLLPARLLPPRNGMPSQPPVSHLPY